MCAPLAARPNPAGRSGPPRADQTRPAFRPAIHRQAVPVADPLADRSSLGRAPSSTTKWDGPNLDSRWTLIESHPGGAPTTRSYMQRQDNH